MNMEDILNEREKTHGNYPIQAETAQSIKQCMKDTPNWNHIPAYYKESLEMVATKIARILHGDPYEPEHSRDGSGYFGLVTRELEVK